jgi:hypothetical protein
MSRLALTPTNVPSSATDISTPTLRAGDLYYNTTEGLKVYTGSAWVIVSGGGGTITEIDAGAFDGVAPYMGGKDPNETSTQTVNGGTP